MAGGNMSVKASGLFETQVLGGIAKRKSDKLAPLNTNISSEGGSSAGGFMSDRAIRQKFLDERRQKMEEQQAAETEALKRTLRWKLADAHAERDRREAARLKSIQAEQEGFVAEVDQFLKNKEDQEVLDRNTLHHVWEKEVYHRIGSQIAKKTGDLKPDIINRRLNDQMDKYVDAVASKTLFRDIIIESEYNPFESKSAVIKVDARPRSKKVWDGIKDPLNEQIEKVMEIHEGKTAFDMPTLKKNPGKATLPLNEWATGVIEDTPHGFAFKAFEKSLAEADLTFEEKQQRAARNISTLTMEHYNYAKGKEAVAAEYPKGKRTYAKQAGQEEGGMQAILEQIPAPVLPKPAEGVVTKEMAAAAKQKENAAMAAMMGS